MVKKKSFENEDLENTTYDQDDYFSLIDLYFDKSKQIMVQHQIDSYNQFLDEIIPAIVKRNGDHIIYQKVGVNKIVRYRLEFTNLGYSLPIFENNQNKNNNLLYPIDAISNSLNYSAYCTADVTQWMDIIDLASDKKKTVQVGETKEKVHYGKIPVMVGSKICNTIVRPDNTKKHCKYDPGSYFIVKGNEKIIVL